MTYQQLLATLHSRRIRFTFDGELKYVAPKGAMTPDLFAALRKHKPDLLHDFHERAAIMQTDAHLPFSEARRLAPLSAFAPYQSPRLESPAQRVYAQPALPL
jgi:hypothetical protein